jgi:hypothetical protein
MKSPAAAVTVRRITEVTPALAFCTLPVTWRRIGVHTLHRLGIADAWLAQFNGPTVVPAVEMGRDDVPLHNHQRQQPGIERILKDEVELPLGNLIDGPVEPRW